MQTLKKQLQQYLESNDLGSIAALAVENRKVLSQLVRLAYDKETLVGWRAIKAIGFAARALVAIDYPFLREMIRKQLWSLSDESGGIGWSAPEIIGEIVSADARRFLDIIPIVAELYDIEEKVFRPGILYALQRIAESDSELILPQKALIIRAISDEDPLVRVHALELVSMIKDSLSDDDKDQVKKLIKTLSSDMSEVWTYKNHGFQNIQVREAAAQLVCDN
jgi:HEAT repeat protein